MNSMFGAEIKTKYIDSLSKDADKDFAWFCFKNFEFAERVHGTHLYDMDDDQLISSVRMSFIAPSNSPSARRIKTHLVNYWKWAKNEGLTQCSEPLKHRYAVHLCSDIAVANRYPKSIDDLYRLLQAEYEDSQLDTLLLIMLGFLLVYDGMDATKLHELKYADVDFEAHTITTGDKETSLSPVTIEFIKTIHERHSFVTRRGARPIVEAAVNRDYVVPRLERMAPFEGKRFQISVTQYKTRRSESLLSADWCTVDSVSLAGHFYRIYAGTDKNDLDTQTQYIYEKWVAVHYSTEH